MTHEPRRRWKRWAAPGALAAAMLFLPAATPVQAHQDQDRWETRRGHGRGHGHGHHRYDKGHRGHRHGYVQAPVRVAYYRPYAPVVYRVLPTAQVVVHGPRLSASVVAYPAAAPVVYAPGYCPAAVHYHPYVAPAPVRGGSGVHGSVNLRIRF